MTRAPQTRAPQTCAMRFKVFAPPAARPAFPVFAAKILRGGAEGGGAAPPLCPVNLRKAHP